MQPLDNQAERRQLVQARRAAFVVPPMGSNQVWQLDFTEFETTRHGERAFRSRVQRQVLQTCQDI